MTVMYIIKGAILAVAGKESTLAESLKPFRDWVSRPTRHFTPTPMRKKNNCPICEPVDRS